MEESLLGVTPSPADPKVYEIFDISYSHIVDPEEDIWNSIVEEKISFSIDSCILNYVQSLLVKAQGGEEKFDSSLSNHVVSVHKSDTLGVLEEIWDFRSDAFTLIDLVLPTNSCMIATTNT